MGYDIWSNGAGGYKTVSVVYNDEYSLEEYIHESNRGFKVADKLNGKYYYKLTSREDPAVEVDHIVLYSN